MNAQTINAPTITITSAVETRYVTTSKGQQKQVFSQKATFHKDGMMLPIDVDLDSPNDAYAVGAVLVWDVTADVVPGQYGRLELARKKTLRPVDNGGRAATKAA